MKEIKIKLEKINDIKEFIKIVQDYSYAIDIAQDRYTVDAKSILGIFSLDLCSDVIVKIHSDNCDDLISKLNKFTNN